MIDNSDLKRYIDGNVKFIQRCMADKAISDDVKKELLEYSFFKIFTKVDLLISQAFFDYACGSSSSAGYVPQRRLTFQDEEHIRNFFISVRKGYVESFSAGIKDISKHIFAINDDPFQLIIATSNLWQAYLQSKIIRDFIAHESAGAKKKYYNEFGITDGSIDAVSHILLEKVRGGKTRYTYLIENLIFITDVIVDPRFVNPSTSASNGSD